MFFPTEGALFEDSVKPYRFEPRYSENELQVITHANNAMIESSSTPVDISWCKCGFCVCDADIDEKVCCKNPLLLPDEEFGNLTCITQTTAFANVCLDRNVLKAALGLGESTKTKHYVQKIKTIVSFQTNSIYGGVTAILVRINGKHYRIVL